MHPEAEALLCGRIDDGSDQTDYDMARPYLTREFQPLQLATELARFRDAAQRLVRSAWGRENLPSVGDDFTAERSANGRNRRAVRSFARYPTTRPTKDAVLSMLPPKELLRRV